MDAHDLEEMIGQLGFSKRCRWETNRSYCCPVLKDEDVDHIVKSLQFAEDMQRLKSVDVQIERGDQPDDQWLITIHLDGEEIQVQHSDIFTAARNAVVQMEGK